MEVISPTFSPLEGHILSVVWEVPSLMFIIVLGSSDDREREIYRTPRWRRIGAPAPGPQVKVISRSRAYLDVGRSDSLSGSADLS